MVRKLKSLQTLETRSEDTIAALEQLRDDVAIGNAKSGNIHESIINKILSTPGKPPVPFTDASLMMELRNEKQSEKPTSTKATMTA